MRGPQEPGYCRYCHAHVRRRLQLLDKLHVALGLNAREVAEYKQLEKDLKYYDEKVEANKQKTTGSTRSARMPD